MQLRCYYNFIVNKFVLAVGICRKWRHEIRELKYRFDDFKPEFLNVALAPIFTVCILFRYVFVFVLVLDGECTQHNTYSKCHCHLPLVPSCIQLSNYMTLIYDSCPKPFPNIPKVISLVYFLRINASTIIFSAHVIIFNVIRFLLNSIGDWDWDCWASMDINSWLQWPPLFIDTEERRQPFQSDRTKDI